ncbi:RagB/SusD family nutrient uptake outer membrane protein [Marinoscillum sp.]|uniref:RagB/SusD family nutrient uptake outer membrane protein n=1 Tax=Marinoscillum sp. TaxID=2024838 RepID=UPI003BAD6C7B
MKRILLLIIPLYVAFSCADLDVAPKTGTTANNIFKNAEAYRQYIAKIYASLSLTGQDGPAGQGDLTIINDEGFTSYIRAYWKAQELPTDEAVIAWNDAGIQDLNTQTWSSDNQFVRVLYYRIFYLISLTNDFMRQSTEGVMDANGVPVEDREEIMQYRAEARFLRALGYWHALDLFRNVPLITTISGDFPEQSNAEGIFNFIESELNEIEPLMAAPRENEYGRADRAALWMLRAKLYLNAEVYTGEDRYSDVIADCNQIISAGYTIEPEYKDLFNADNHNSDELIFTLPADGVNSQSWGSTTFLVHAAVGGELMVPADYGIDGGWEGLRTTKVFVSKFADITGATDTRANFYSDGQTLEIEDLRTFTNGYAVPKYTNLTASGGVGSNTTHVDTDYPMFRLGDVYLMYAEAHLRGGGGDAGTALGYVNALRERAYGNASGNITSGQLSLDFILDERSRELHWEATRRVDLIRFGRFTDSGVWPWKGGEMEGTTTGSYLNIFPIPAFELNANPNMEQNPEY